MVNAADLTIGMDCNRIRHASRSVWVASNTQGGGGERVWHSRRTSAGGDTASVYGQLTKPQCRLSFHRGFVVNTIQ